MERFLWEYALHVLLYFYLQPWWFLLPTPLRTWSITALELPTFYPRRFQWDNRDTAASTQCHSYNSATCGSKRNSNSPPVTETTKKVHGSKEEWCRYLETTYRTFAWNLESNNTLLHVMDKLLRHAFSFEPLSFELYLNCGVYLDLNYFVTWRLRNIRDQLQRKARRVPVGQITEAEASSWVHAHACGCLCVCVHLRVCMGAESLKF